MLAGGAIETALLLLLSDLGNAHDQVGRHPQGHVYPMAYGLFDAPIYDPRGPGVTLATTDFNHGNGGIVGGGLLADDFAVLTAIFWKTMRAPDAPKFGAAADAPNSMRKSSFTGITAPAKRPRVRRPPFGRRTSIPPPGPLA